MTAHSDPASRMGDLVTAVLTADADGIVQSTASAVTEQVLTGTALNGALMSAGQISGSDARNIRAATGANAGSYAAAVGKDIVVRGTRNGQAFDVRFTITDEDGGESFETYMMLDPGTDITVTLPACTDTSGSFTVGAGTGKKLHPNGTRPKWLDVAVAGDVTMHLINGGENLITRTFADAGPQPYAADAVYALTSAEVQAALGD